MKIRRLKSTCGESNIFQNDVAENLDDVSIYSTEESNEDKIVEHLRDAISRNIEHILVNRFGSDPVDVKGDYIVQVSLVNIGEDSQPAAKIEVRAELNYEEFEYVIDVLDNVIQSYDSDAYFEPVDVGIIEAYVDIDNIHVVYGSTSEEYKNRFLYQYHGKSFSVYSNDISLIDSKSESGIDDVYYLWKANVSQQAGAYNDADEDYVYAFIRGQGVVEYYKKGKYVATSNYNLRDEDDFEEVWEYMQIILDDVCDHLIDYNKDVPDRMIHNSTDVQYAREDNEFFIEDIMEKLREAGYDTSDVEDIKVGLERYLGYDEETSDTIINDLIDGQYIELNPLMFSEYDTDSDSDMGKAVLAEDTKELNEIPSIEALIELDVNIDIYVEDDGEIVYENELSKNDDYDWASSNNSGESWTLDDYPSITIRDPQEVADDIMDLIYPNIPTRPGVYNVEGSAELYYTVSGLMTEGDTFSRLYDEDIISDNVEITFEFSKSRVNDLNIDRK